MHRFDFVIALLLSCIALPAYAQDGCPAKESHKLRICHNRGGLQASIPIEVSVKAVSKAHSKHGDSLAGADRLDCDCQPDYDGDLLSDFIDPCPADPDNECDPAGSTAKTVAANGATLTTPDGATTMIIPPLALPGETPISITDTDNGSNFGITTTNGELLGILGFEIAPDGLIFEVPVTIVVQWQDANSDGFVDQTTVNERALLVFKDGVPLTDTCENDLRCDPAANTFSISVTSLSRFVAGVPLDSDDDGIPDRYQGERDNCPTTPNADQQNSDSDGHGDACDNCVAAANQNQADMDADGLGDACDLCPGDEVAGTACGDPADTECTNPDTCDGSGRCQDNHAGDGTLCGDAGTEECIKQDICTAGVCEDQGYQLSGCFPNGVAAGDVDQSSVVLWARALFAGTVRFEYVRTEDGENPDFSNPDGVVDFPVEDSNVPAKVVITGLESGTQYYYRACPGSCPSTVQDNPMAWGKFRTPHADGRHGLRFGVSSCWDGDLKPFVSIRNVPDRSLDFFVALGDTVYADRAKEVSEYRKKHQQNYQQTDSPDDNFFALARASTAFYVDIDDHEVVNNFAGGASPMSQQNSPECKDGPKDGDLAGICFCDPDAGTNDPNCRAHYINDTDLFENGLQAWREYNPVNDDEIYGETGDDRTSEEYKIYRYRSFGDDAALFMLDTRSFRDEADVELAYSPNRTMLGKTQLDELLSDLQAAEENGITWKFVLVPEPIQYLGIAGIRDRFEGYAHERGVILDFIENQGIANVVFISGDIHGTIVNNLTYELNRRERQRFSASWDISTGPAAHTPIGPASFITKFDQTTAREQLDKRFRRRMNYLLGVQQRPKIGLSIDPIIVLVPKQQWNRRVPEASLRQGSYVAAHTYGWTEFEIEPSTQALVVTTFGTDWRIDEPGNEEEKKGLLLSSGNPPEIVSQFSVEPERCDRKSGGGAGQLCSEDNECRSCICGRAGVDQCVPKGGLANGEPCARDLECESGICNDWGLFSECAEPGKAGDHCTEDNECESGICAQAGVNECAPTGSLQGGARCTRNVECESLECIASGPIDRCTPFPGGVPCSKDADCEKGEICSSTGLFDQCTPFPDNNYCESDSECADGSVCNDVLLNQCQPKAGEGDLCTEDSECSGNQVCNDAGVLSRCKFPGVQSDRCAEDSECDKGLICNDVGLLSRCEPPGKKGEPCSEDNECESGICAQAGVNECAPTGGLQGGERCTRDVECESLECIASGPIDRCTPFPGGVPCSKDADCEKGEICSSTGLFDKCTPFPDGKYCESDSECADGSVCNDVRINECAPKAGEGERCTEDSECSGNKVCNDAGLFSTCEFPGVQGDRCAEDSECEGGLVCNDVGLISRCESPAREGDACTQDNECEAGLVCNDVGLISTCELPGTKGEPCTQNSECRENLVCNDVGLISKCASADCKANGKSCARNGDCCSNSCRDDVFGAGSSCRAL